MFENTVDVALPLMVSHGFTRVLTHVAETCARVCIPTSKLTCDAFKLSSIELFSDGIVHGRFVWYILSKISMLQHNGVIPLVVFDGGRLPMKADEEDTRRSSRNENREKAVAHLAAGNIAAAEECFQRAVNVTSTMIKQVIEVTGGKRLTQI